MHVYKAILHLRLDDKCSFKVSIYMHVCKTILLLRFHDKCRFI